MYMATQTLLVVDQTLVWQKIGIELGSGEFYPNPLGMFPTKAQFCIKLVLYQILFSFDWQNTLFAITFSVDWGPLPQLVKAQHSKIYKLWTRSCGQIQWMSVIFSWCLTQQLISDTDSNIFHKIRCYTKEYTKYIFFLLLYKFVKGSNTTVAGYVFYPTKYLYNFSTYKSFIY